MKKERKGPKKASRRQNHAFIGVSVSASMARTVDAACQMFGFKDRAAFLRSALEAAVEEIPVTSRFGK